MKKTRRKVTERDLAEIRTAITKLKVAREALQRAGAKNAATYVQRALKSVQGAERHAIGHVNRAARAEPAGELPPLNMQVCPAGKDCGAFHDGHRWACRAWAQNACPAFPSHSAEVA